MSQKQQHDNRVLLSLLRRNDDIKDTPPSLKILIHITTSTNTRTHTVLDELKVRKFRICTFFISYYLAGSRYASRPNIFNGQPDGTLAEVKAHAVVTRFRKNQPKENKRSRKMLDGQSISATPDTRWNHVFSRHSTLRRGNRVCEVSVPACGQRTATKRSPLRLLC